MSIKYNVIKDHLDDGIKEAVRILIDYGITTFESCEGGDGHEFSYPTIRFEGDVFDCIRVMDICQKNKLNVYECKLCFRRLDGVLDPPFCEVSFLKHEKTGTIFLAD